MNLVCAHEFRWRKKNCKLLKWTFNEVTRMLTRVIVRRARTNGISTKRRGENFFYSSFMNIWTEMPSRDIFNHSNSQHDHFNSIHFITYWIETKKRMEKENRKKNRKYKWNNIIPYNNLILRAFRLSFDSREHSLFDYEYFLNLYKQFLLFFFRKSAYACCRRWFLFRLLLFVCV